MLKSIQKIKMIERRSIRNCPKCGVETFVIDSRPDPNGGIRRRRKCEACGYRYSTIEILYEEKE